MPRKESELEAEIRRLRDDLFTARMALIGMAPNGFQEFFSELFGCKSRAEAYEWHGHTVAKIVERVPPRPAAEMGDVAHNGPRAYCPLCGGSADNIYQIQGFAHPEGLARHLEGSFNARHCDVMKAALALACEAAEDATARTLTIRSNETPRKRGARK